MSTATLSRNAADVLEEESVLTVGEYHSLPGIARHELVHGKLIPLAPPNEFHADLTANLVEKLRPFVRNNNLGKIYVELGFILPGPDGIIRIPDVAFVETSRLHPSRNKSRSFEGAPTIAIEIISPSDTWPDVEDKVRLYLRSGTKVVWLIEPEKQIVSVRTPNSNHILVEDDVLDATGILPGWQLPLPELFED